MPAETQIVFKRLLVSHLGRTLLSSIGNEIDARPDFCSEEQTERRRRSIVASDWSGLNLYSYGQFGQIFTKSIFISNFATFSIHQHKVELSCLCKAPKVDELSTSCCTIFGGIFFTHFCAEIFIQMNFDMVLYSVRCCLNMRFCMQSKCASAD